MPTAAVITAFVDFLISLALLVVGRVEPEPSETTGSIKNLRLVDGNVILDNREAWIARWNKEVAK